MNDEPIEMKLVAKYKLIPCPFCASTRVEIRGATACYGQCLDCGASTGVYDHPADAERAWNTRNGTFVQIETNLTESEATT